VTFGSFKLGVIGPGSDIDTLVVAPSNITAEDFFSTFPDLLQKMAPEGAITDLTLKPEAFAPIITLRYQGVDIDLQFGRIAIHNPRSSTRLNRSGSSCVEWCSSGR
jgi:poly(A) polymerase